jgi:hypothetical protein
MKRVKAIFGVLIVVAFFYLTWKILPPYMTEYQFQQGIQDIARENEYSPADENGIRDQVKKKIAELGVPVNPDNVVIQKSQFDVTIGANYSVHIDAALFPFDLTFHPATKNGSPTDPVSSAPANR